MDCWGSCWAVLMGKISQAERWILFVMLHRPPSTQSAEEASSVVPPLSLSELSWHCVHLHQLLPSYFPLLLPAQTHISNTSHRVISNKRQEYLFFSILNSFTSCCSCKYAHQQLSLSLTHTQNESKKRREEGRGDVGWGGGGGQTNERIAW